MSYTVANTGGAKARPGTVALASGLLYAAAGLILVSAGLSLYAFLEFDMTGLVETRGVDQQTMETMTQVVGIVSVALYLALAVGFAVLGGLVGKGKNAARVVTWTLGGIGVICCGCSAVSSAFSGAMMSNMQGVDEATLAEMTTILPGWLNAANLVLEILIILTLLTAIVLLLLPASNDFFRREHEVWIPPTYSAGGFPPPAGPGALPPAPPGPGTLPPPPGGGTSPLPPPPQQ
jgi:hypothetical protein